MQRIALVLAVLLGVIRTAEAQEKKFFVGSTTELLEIRAVADNVRSDNLGGQYCLGFLGWWCGTIDAACWAPPYTGSCGTVPIFWGLFSVQIGHVWGPATGDATAGGPGQFDFFELPEAPLATYIGQTRTIDGGQVTIPQMMTFAELPQAAQNAIIAHVCTGAAAEHCQAGVLYCCE
jgi:hypothetical protein